jgi:hypothetical protein
MQRMADAGADCCFCGDPVAWRDALQLVLFEQREIDSGEEDPQSQQFWAHKPCLEAAVAPTHRMFFWESDEDES